MIAFSKRQRWLCSIKSQLFWPSSHLSEARLSLRRKHWATRTGLAEFGNTHIGGAFAFAGYPDPHHHVSQGSRIGSVHVDLGVKGYGCLGHPDYGLYTPHFC